MSVYQFNRCIAKVIYWRYEIYGFFRHEALLVSFILTDFSIIDTQGIKSKSQVYSQK